MLPGPSSIERVRVCSPNPVHFCASDTPSDVRRPKAGRSQTEARREEPHAPGDGFETLTGSPEAPARKFSGSGGLTLAPTVPCQFSSLSICGGFPAPSPNGVTRSHVSCNRLQWGVGVGHGMRRTFVQVSNNLGGESCVLGRPRVQDEVQVEGRNDVSAARLCPAQHGPYGESADKKIRGPARLATRRSLKRAESQLTQQLYAQHRVAHYAALVRRRLRSR